MKKRIVMLGLLAGVLSLNSCVKDNESESVKAQRQAQVEKTKAEAAKSLAEAKVSEAIVKVNEAQAKISEAQAKVSEAQAEATKAETAFKVAMNDIKLKEKNAGLDQKLEAQVAAQTKALMEAKKLLEQAQMESEYEINNFKQKLQVKKDQLAQEIEDYKGTKEEKAYANIAAKYNAYANALMTLMSEKQLLADMKVQLQKAENDVVDVKAEKEAAIAENNRKIAIEEKKIEEYKKYENSKDVPTLKSELAQKEIALAAAENDYELKNKKYSSLNRDASDASDLFVIPFEKRRHFKFFYSLYKLQWSRYNTVDETSVQGESETLNDGIYTVTRFIYDANSVSSMININRTDLYIDELKADVEQKKEDVANAKQDEKSKYDTYVAKKDAYEADKKDAAKKNEYENALSDYENAKGARMRAEERQANAEDKLKEIVEYKSAITNADNVKEVKEAVNKYNELQREAMKAYIVKEKASYEKRKLDAEVDALRDIIENTTTGAEKIAEKIKDSQDEIKSLKEDNADLSNITSAENYVAYLTAKVEKQKGDIALAEKKVAITKAAYEAVLN